MTRVSKKLLSVVLSLALMVSVLATFFVASHAEDSATPQFKGYTIIGDSITAGMGIKKAGNWDKNLKPAKVDYQILSSMVNVPEGYYGVDDIEALRQLAGGVTYRVHGSYADYVGKAVGIKIKDDSAASYAKLEQQGYYNLSLPGVRSTEIRKMLDPSYQGDQYTDEIFGIVNPAGYETLHNKAVEYIQNSELVTIACGSNDVALNCIIRALHAIYDDNIPVDVEQLVLSLVAQGRLPEAVTELSDTAKILGKAPLAAAAYLQGLAEGSVTFFQNWDAIISSIYNINPNAKIVALGFYNPFKTFAITNYGDENFLRIGHALDALLGALDLHVTTLASTRNLYTYVNIWDTDVIGIMPLAPNLFNDYFKYILFNVHPTNGGHKYIANQIIKALQGDTSVQQLANPIPNLAAGYHYVGTVSSNYGTISANTLNSGAQAGANVRVNVYPEEGHRLSKLMVIDENGHKVECETYAQGVYTFIMPDCAVQVEAMFV